MTTYYLILFVVSVLNIVLSWVPVVTSLPFGIDLFLSAVFGYVQAFGEVFWPFKPILNVIFFMIPFYLTLLVVKVFLGARTPHADL